MMRLHLTSNSFSSNTGVASSNPTTLRLELMNDYLATRRIRKSKEEKKKVKCDELPYDSPIDGIDFSSMSRCESGKLPRPTYQ